MRLEEVLFLYLCIGLVVSLAVPWSRRPLVVPLWPLYLPALLTRSDARFDTVERPAAVEATGEIERALGHLREALALWDAAPALPLEATERALTELQRRRLALAALLARPENAPGEAASDGSEARARRRENLLAMGALHDRLASELGEALARVEELATRIQLAHFGGGPMEEVARQLADLVQAVDHVRAAHGEVDGG